MAKIVKKEQYVVYNETGNHEIHHFETDSDVVIMPTGVTLSEWVAAISTYRKIVLSGDVTGSAIFNTAKEGNIEIDAEVTDDSHQHTGATVKVEKPLRVVTSGASNDLVVSDVTSDELNTLKGVKSNIQKQLDDLTVLASGTGIAVGETAPENQQAGDLWLQTI